MDTCHEADDIQFSSVHIHLTPVTRQSQLKILRWCTESPQFLQNYVNRLLRPEHIRALQEAKLKGGTFRITIVWPPATQGILIYT